MSTNSLCGCGGCGCDICRPASTIYRSTCTDVGSQDTLNYLLGTDSQFCPVRLPVQAGVLTSQIDGSGNQAIAFTETPVVDLPTFQAAVGVALPNLMVIASNNQWFEMLGPAVANQILLTNAAGALLFAPIPAATVPDPLTVGNLTVSTAASINALTVTGSVIASGIGSGTPTSILGLDGSNNVVKQTATTFVSQCAMFFEAPTSPSATTPNKNVFAGSNLTIGNLLFDSGATLINVTNGQTLTVAVAGAYELNWWGFVFGSAGSPSINLLINGITVNYGNGMFPSTPNQVGRNSNLSGGEMRRLAVGDTIQLQLGSQSGGSIETYQVRLTATRVSA